MGKDGFLEFPLPTDAVLAPRPLAGLHGHQSKRLSYVAFTKKPPLHAHSGATQVAKSMHNVFKPKRSRVKENRDRI